MCLHFSSLLLSILFLALFIFLRNLHLLLWKGIIGIYFVIKTMPYQQAQFLFVQRQARQASLYGNWMSSHRTSFQEGRITYYDENERRETMTALEYNNKTVFTCGRTRSFLSNKCAKIKRWNDIIHAFKKLFVYFTFYVRHRSFLLKVRLYIPWAPAEQTMSTKKVQKEKLLL